jgi:hypothetical protein
MNGITRLLTVVVAVFGLLVVGWATAGANSSAVYTDAAQFATDTGATAVPFPTDADTALLAKPFGSGLTDYSCAQPTLSLSGGEIAVTNPTGDWICYIGAGWNAGTANTNPTPVAPTIVANGEDDYRIEMNFSQPQHAVGFGLLTNSTAVEAVTLYYSDATSEVFADAALDTAANAFEFIGFRSHKPIVKVELDTTGGGSQNEGITGIWSSPFYEPPTTACGPGEVFVSSVGIGAATPVVPVPAAAGYPYAVTASGTYFAGGTYAYDIQADAEYSQDAYQRLNALPWTDLVRNYEPLGEGLLELKVDGGFVEWGSFAADHTYTIERIATGPFGFQIYYTYAQNNTGGLCVDVDPIPRTAINGGGQIIEEFEGAGPKPPKPLKVSFGGWLQDIDGGVLCEWQVNFHNVGNDALDKAKFHTTDCFDLTTWEGDFDGVVRFHANGAFNGAPGYSAIFRMEDYTEPSEMDTLRLEIYDSGNALVYDTYADFPGDSTNIGTARTFLDRGNIQIDFYE